MDTPDATQPDSAPHIVTEGASKALKELIDKCGRELPEESLKYIEDKEVNFTSPIGKGKDVLFPCPLKQQDAVGAIKGLEALMASALANLRFKQDPRVIDVDMMKVACFISSAYITTVDGYHKGEKEVKGFLTDTDINNAQSNLYRRHSAGLYETKDKKHYHIHGSLDATTTLEMIGLPSTDEKLTESMDIIETIGGAVRQFDVKTLEKLNNENEQAGVQALRRDEFLRTRHGKVMNGLPPFTVRASGSDGITPKVDFGKPESEDKSRRLLEGIRVLELCRIIAGPTIGRSLAALGADVMKVTCDKLPDVPFFQVDGNTGKVCKNLNLEVDEDREKFDQLLLEADVVIDGYRPGKLDKRGYGPKGLGERAMERGKGYVYVAEDCFGGTEVGGDEAEWAHRPGWQQIADCVTGVAWEQGLFMKKEEPVIPPFPMSDYGTGTLGSIAALVGLYNRATLGKSWVCRTSLVQYDLFLLSLGLHSDEVQDKLRREHSPEFFDLRHCDSVDKVGQTALDTINKAHDMPFEGEGLMQGAPSPGFGDGMVRWPTEAVQIEGLAIRHRRVTRPNGFDKDVNGWDGWQCDKSLSG